METTILAEAGAKNLGAQAYEKLLEMILSGALPPGTLLQEQALADELAISRTPVRQALAKLEHEGLVTRHVGRLLIVREMPVGEFMEILRVRQLLEGEAIALACRRIADAELAKLRKAFESLLSDEGSNAESQGSADDALHEAIADASGNSVLAEMVRGLRKRTRIFNLNNLPDRFVPGGQEHLEIVAALERRDEAAARRLIVAHLENVGQSILRKLGKH
jgi:DNA-binding GntR family transcriptional regulator